MAKTIGVEKLQENYNSDMTKFEADHEVAKTFVDTRYAGKRTESYGKSKEALKETKGHLKTGGKHLLDTAIDIGTAIGAPFYFAGKAALWDAPLTFYHAVLEGGYDVVRAGGIAGTAEITTRVNASKEKGALGGKLKETKVRTTLAYAAAAQGAIDDLNGEVVPFEERVAALKVEIKKIETEAGKVKGDKFDMVVERDALIEMAAELKKPWYRKLI